MSRTEKARESRRSVSRKAWVVVGLAVFVAVDILLIALALGWGREAAQSAELQASSQTAGQTEDDSEDTVDEPQPSPEPEETRPVPRLLSVVSDTVAWRSEGGICNERGEIELTVDGGETWGSAYPAAEELGRPLWLSGADYTAVQAALASGQECLPDGLRTYDSGATWTQEDQVITNSVFVDPIDSSAIRWGGEGIEGPCGAITQVAVTGGTASAVCQDGALWNLGSQSGSWEQIGVSGATAVTGSNGRWIAAVESAECDGLGLVGLNGASVQALACLPAELVGAVTVNFTGDNLWLWVDDHVLVSTDGGRSFD